MNRRNVITAAAALVLSPWEKLFGQSYQPTTGLQIRYVNLDVGLIGAFWNPATFPPEAQQLQFRSVSNVSAGNTGVGYDLISTAEGIKGGRAFLSNPQVIKSGVLLQIAAVPISSGPEYDYSDVEAGIIHAIVPL